jgi:hypothetical protein
MKIRDAKPDELIRPASPAELSPRQKAILERESKFRKMLDSLGPQQLKAIEPDQDEKLGTLQASLLKVIADDHRSTHLAVKRGIIYVSPSPIPGARKAREPREKVAAASAAN